MREVQEVTPADPALVTEGCQQAPADPQSVFLNIFADLLRQGYVFHSSDIIALRSLCGIDASKEESREDDFVLPRGIATSLAEKGIDAGCQSGEFWYHTASPASFYDPDQLNEAIEEAFGSLNIAETLPQSDLTQPDNTQHKTSHHSRLTKDQKNAIGTFLQAHPSVSMSELGQEFKGVNYGALWYQLQKFNRLQASSGDKNRSASEADGASPPDTLHDAASLPDSRGSSVTSNPIAENDVSDTSQAQLAPANRRGRSDEVMSVHRNSSHQGDFHSSDSVYADDVQQGRSENVNPSTTEEDISISEFFRRHPDTTIDEALERFQSSNRKSLWSLRAQARARARKNQVEMNGASDPSTKASEISTAGNTENEKRSPEPHQLHGSEPAAIDEGVSIRVEIPTGTEAKGPLDVHGQMMLLATILYNPEQLLSGQAALKYLQNGKNGSAYTHELQRVQAAAESIKRYHRRTNTPSDAPTARHTRMSQNRLEEQIYEERKLIIQKVRKRIQEGQEDTLFTNLGREMQNEIDTLTRFLQEVLA